jgi:hypothetical protein
MQCQKCKLVSTECVLRPSDDILCNCCYQPYPAPVLPKRKSCRTTKCTQDPDFIYASLVDNQVLEDSIHMISKSPLPSNVDNDVAVTKQSSKPETTTGSETDGDSTSQSREGHQGTPRSHIATSTPQSGRQIHEQDMQNADSQRSTSLSAGISHSASLFTTITNDSEIVFPEQNNSLRLQDLTVELLTANILLDNQK